MERRAGIGRGRLGAAARAPPQPQPETREMQAQSIEQITQGLQNATVGGRYRPSARVPRPAHREEGSTDSGHYSGHASSDPPSPEHQSLQARVRAEVKTKEQKRMEDDLFDQGKHLQPAMKQKIEEGKFYGTSGTEVMLSSNFYRVRIWPSSPVFYSSFRSTCEIWCATSVAETCRGTNTASTLSQL